ncbi:MAG: hypothetical protein AAF492_11685 [Verrucomicrobiota bacterium]
MKCCSKESLVPWLVLLGGFLVVIEFIYHKHVHFSLEKLPLFYALFGFGVCRGVLWLAQQIQTRLQREEDYYDG